jgi:START domain
MIKYILLLVFLFISIEIVSAQTDWKLSKNENGIALYKRKRANGMLEIKIITEINKPMEVIKDKILNVTQHQTWVYSCIEAKLLSTKNTNENINVTYMDFPWPLENREILNKTIISFPTQEKIVIASSPTDYPTLKSKYLRITDAENIWTLQKTSEESTKVEYFLYADPKTNLSNGMVNMFTTVGPMKTVTTFKTQLEN